MDFIRIIPVQRFHGSPAPPHKPYALYADSYSLHGRTIADCYRLVNGLNLPPKVSGYEKECRTPFAWNYPCNGNPDAPLAKIGISSNGKVKYTDYSLEWLESTKYVVLRVNINKAQKNLDPFPATWRALSYIVSDPERMGASKLSWDMRMEEFSTARIHAFFCQAHSKSGKGLLAAMSSKENLGLSSFEKLPDWQEELEYYHYLSVDSAFTNEIVDLFGISHRCWHGCGYLGWPGFPLCRFFLLRNKFTPDIKLSVLGGRERYFYTETALD